MSSLERHLILHVGMDKTGTSAIQDMLKTHRGRLEAEASVLVPKTGLWTDGSHHPFAFAALGMAGFAPGDLGGLFSDLEREIATSAAGTVLLTSECLFKVPHHVPDSPFWQHLERLFATVRVLIYVRRQDRWVESRHRHSIVSGKEIPIKALSTPFFCDYRPYIDQWAAIFGKGNVAVRPYERAQFVGGDIGRDFLVAIGAGQVAAGKSDTRNEAFFYDDVLFRALANHLGLETACLDRLNQLLLARPHDRQSDRRLLSPSRAAELVTRYRDCNEGLARDYAGRVDGRLFLDPPPDPGTAWTEPELTVAGARELLEFIRNTDQKLHSKVEDRLRAMTPESLPDPRLAERFRRVARALAEPDGRH